MRVMTTLPIITNHGAQRIGTRAVTKSLQSPWIVGRELPVMPAPAISRSENRTPIAPIARRGNIVGRSAVA
jgi:hypothetical protein